MLISSKKIQLISFYISCDRHKKNRVIYIFFRLLPRQHSTHRLKRDGQMCRAATEKKLATSSDFYIFKIPSHDAARTQLGREKNVPWECLMSFNVAGATMKNDGNLLKFVAIEPIGSVDAVYQRNYNRIHIDLDIEILLYCTKSLLHRSALIQFRLPKKCHSFLSRWTFRSTLNAARLHINFISVEWFFVCAHGNVQLKVECSCTWSLEKKTAQPWLVLFAVHVKCSWCKKAVVSRLWGLISCYNWYFRWIIWPSVVLLSDDSDLRLLCIQCLQHKFSELSTLLFLIIFRRCFLLQKGNLCCRSRDHSPTVHCDLMSQKTQRTWRQIGLGERTCLMMNLKSLIWRDFFSFLLTMFSLEI